MQFKHNRLKRNIMDSLKNNIKVFFNRLEQTWNFYLDMENEVRGKINEYNSQISKEGIDLFPEFVGFDDRYKGLLREGLLIQICSLLEHSMVQVCKKIIPEYEVRLKKKKGNWLDKHLALLGQENINGLEADDVLYLSDFIGIRNCFVHASGIVYQTKYSDNIKKSVNRLQELGKQRNSDIIKMSDDEYIILGSDALSEVFSRGEEVMMPVFEYVFQKLIV